MANIPFLNNASFSAAITVANSATASNFITTTDSGININGITLTRVATNSAIRVGDGLETLGLLRSYSNLIVATTGAFGGDVLVEDNLYLTDAGTVRGKIQLNSSDRDDLDIKAVSLGSNMKFFTVDTERMRINSSGDVGIGTTNPSRQLDVEGVIRFSSSSNQAVNGFGEIYTSFSYGKGQIFIAPEAVTSPTNFHPNGGVTIGPANTSPPANGLIVSGNVGIGTTSPLAKLHTKSGNSGVGSVDTGTSAIIESNTTNYLRFLSTDSSKAGLVWTTPGDNFAAYLRYGYSDQLLEISTANSNDSISFSTGNASEKMRILSSGNVGVNTTNPNSKLDVRRAGSGIALELHQTSGSANDYVDLKMIAGNTNAGTFGTILRHKRDGSGGGDFSILTNPTLTGAPTEKLTVKSNGNVGIGTTSPNQLLEVANSSGGATINISTDQAAGSIASKKFNNLDFSGYNNNVLARIQSWDESYNTGHGYLTFSTFKAGGSLTEKMRIDYNGNVGIGTASPLAKLNIESPLGSDIAFRLTQTSKNWWEFKNTGGTNDLNLSDAFGTYVTFKTNGNVGIGTTSPGAKLDVAGTGNFTGLVSGITPVAAANFVTKAYVDGSGGGTGPFLPLAGGTMTGVTQFNDHTQHGDQVSAKWGAGNDLTIKHNATDSFIENNTGHLSIVNYANDKDITLWNDDGTGGIAKYLVLDGNTTHAYFSNPGNVGIGTTSPDAKLSISKSSFSTNFTSSDAYIRLGEVENALNKYQFIGFGYNDAPTSQVPAYFGFQQTATGNYTNGALVFGTRNVTTDATPTERMRITSAGNVGIGTTSPTAARLVVDSGTAPQILVKNTAGGDAKILLEDGSGVTQNASITFNESGQNTLTIATGYQSPSNANKINIAPAGHVALTAVGGSGGTSATKIGIGTTSPGAKLHVEGAPPATNGALINIRNSEATGTNTSFGGIYFNSSPGNDFSIGKSNINAATTLSFRNSNDGASLMDITPSGNVGIGTTAPGAKLEVNGQIVINSTALGGQDAFSIYNSTNQLFHIQNSSTNDEASLLLGANNVIKVKLDTAGNSYLNGGNVGIGTTAPAAKLHVKEPSGSTSQIKMSAASNEANYGYLTMLDNTVNTAKLTFGTTFGYNTPVDAMTIFNGKVGIGISNPIAPLHITGPAPTAVQPVIKVERTSPVVDYQDTSTTNGYLFFTERFLNLAGSIISTRKVQQNPGGSGVYTIFNHGLLTGQGTEHNQRNNSFHWKIDNSTNEVLTISTSGKVGIGITSPAEKLTVSGAANITGKFAVGIAATHASFDFYNQGTAYFNGAVTIDNTLAVSGTNITVANASNPYLYLNDTNAGAGIFQQEGNTTRIGSDSNTQVVLVQNNATAVTIDTSKNVGIGTTSPDLKLDVVSGLNNGIRISASDTTSNWRDISIRSYVSETEANALGDNTHIYTTSPIGTSTETPFSYYGATVIQGRNNGNGGFAIRLGNGSGHSTMMWMGTTGVTVFSNTVTATNFILSSDERLKENIEKACDNRIKADWKTFELKTDKGQKRYGVIAQELEKTNPEFVREDTQGFKSVAYIDLLIAKIAELEARLEKLEK